MQTNAHDTFTNKLETVETNNQQIRNNVNLFLMTSNDRFYIGDLTRDQQIDLFGSYIGDVVFYLSYGECYHQKVQYQEIKIDSTILSTFNFVTRRLLSVATWIS